MAVWVLAGWQPLLAAIAQTALLVSLNTAGMTLSRHLIPDPPGMLIKNFAFLMLAWPWASGCCCSYSPSLGRTFRSC